MGEPEGGSQAESALDSRHDGPAREPSHCSSPHLEEYVLRLLDECREEVQMSDSKANMLFAGVATVVAIMLNILLDDGSRLRTSGDAVIVLSVLSLAVFTIALVFLALAVTPRLGRPERGKARYFQEHAEFVDSESLLQVLVVDAEDAVERHAQQLHVLARIVRRKYQHLRRAMQATSLAMVILALVAFAAAFR